MLGTTNVELDKSGHGGGTRQPPRGQRDLLDPGDQRDEHRDVLHTQPVLRPRQPREGLASLRRPYLLNAAPTASSS